jgi:GntR family transcriptional regulator
LQVKEQVRHRVALGDWLPGREIPSIRALAADMRVSVITIKRAYLELEHEGVIITRQGRGSFVADAPRLATASSGAELDQHLGAALRAGAAMGLDAEEIATRLRTLAARTTKDRES